MFVLICQHLPLQGLSVEELSLVLASVRCQNLGLKAVEDTDGVIHEYLQLEQLHLVTLQPWGGRDRRKQRFLCYRYSEEAEANVSFLVQWRS